MKHFVYVFLLLLGLLSCRQSSVDGTLSGIDSVLSEHPEKALAQLDSVRKYMQPYLMGESVPSDGVSYYRSLYYMKTNDFQLAEKELWELAANKRLDVRKHAYLQLTSLFLQQGKVERADSCFQEFVECSDSLELESESEKEAKGTALYDYMYQKERGNQLEIDNKNDLLLILLLGMILLILLSLVAFYWQMSIMKKIKLQNKLKDLKIHSILSPMDSAHLNEQILPQVGINANLSQGKHLSDEQWQKLQGVFNSHYPHFKDHLYSCSKLSEQEYHVCMLVKLGLGSSKISVLTSKAISTISTTKQRLFKKITREDGSADQLAELLTTM